jgi:DNA-binding NtrC family response regulator
MRDHQEESFTEEVKAILVVEDDEGIGEVIQLALAEEPGYDTIVVANPYEALRVASNVKPNLFIIDYRLSSMNGIALYEQLHATDGLQGVPAILMSASIEQLQQELSERNLTGLAKPFSLDELVETIKQVAA